MSGADWKNASAVGRPSASRDVGKPRGLLRHAPGPGCFHHARIAPSRALADLVQHYWIVRWDLRGLPPQRRETLPHPNVHLVLDAVSGSRVHGVHTGRFTRELAGEGGVFGIKFRPGGFRPFLQKPVSILRDRSLPLGDLFAAADAEALESRVLSEAPDDEAMVAAAEEFLSLHRPPADPDIERVGAIVDGVAEDRAVTRVEQVLERWQLRPRTLQRLFNDYVGVGAKWVINRYRLHEAVERLAEDRPVDWPQLALDLGYFDQAHFIRDFKAMTGRTPADYARGSP